MTYILHIETATKICSVALSRDGKLCQLKESSDEQYSHGEKLGLFIEEVLSLEKITAKNLSAVSVASGPGSYTGLRIGVSMAKGLCYGTNIPLIAIDALTSLKELAQEKHKNQTIIPMIDARRMEVFCSVFKNGTLIKPIAAEILDENSFSDYEPFVVVGDAVSKLKEIWANRKIILDELIVSSAKGQIKLAWEKFQLKDFENLAYFEPFYLKDFVSNKKD